MLTPPSNQEELRLKKKIKTIIGLAYFRGCNDGEAINHE